jgi:hypothetical protein
MAGFEVMKLSTASLWVKEKCNLVIGHNSNRLVTGFSQQICCDMCSALDAVPAQTQTPVTSAQVLSLTRRHSDF